MVESSLYRVIVVGCNRQRLNKIMEMVHEEEKNQSSSAVENDDSQIGIEFIPCVAKMDSYQGEDGQTIRYMASLSYHDGSSLAQFFDDDKIRESLSGAVMIGYEWHDEDQAQIENYFTANNVKHLEYDCVTPNDGFDSLQTEMDGFKSLDATAKEHHTSNRTMGPGKMARYTMNMADHIREEKMEVIRALAKSEEASAQAIETRPEVNLKVPDSTMQRYACRKCRFMLLDEDDLCDDHVPNLHSFDRRNYHKARPTVVCQSIFCKDDVLSLLAPDGCEIEGRLECPKCSSKIGHWKWSGTQCNCGTWITPSIQIPLSKVDTVKANFVSNMPIGMVQSPFLKSEP